MLFGLMGGHVESTQLAHVINFTNSEKQDNGVYPPFYFLNMGHDEKLTQNAHVLVVHSAFSLVFALFSGFSLSVK
jgi:hypothetical protein